MGKADVPVHETVRGEARGVFHEAHLLREGNQLRAREHSSDGRLNCVLTKDVCIDSVACGIFGLISAKI